VTWRFHLMSLPSRVWVDRDLDLGAATVTESVSAPASISGTVSLGYANRSAIKEWGCMIIAEQEGRDPIAAIVDSIATDGDNLKVEAGGFSMYPTGMPWTSAAYSSTSVDPLDVVRLIWSNLQAQPAGDLGVVVDGTKTGIRLGVPEDAKLTAAKAVVADATAREKASKASYEAAVRSQATAKTSLLAAAARPSTGLLIQQDSAPSGDKRTVKNLWLDKNDGNKGYVWNGKKWVLQTTSSQATINTRLAAWTATGTTVTNAKAAWEARKKDLTTAKAKQSAIQGGEAEPFQLTWWDTHDLGSVIDELAKSTPFEYREQSSWINDGDDVAHRLEIGAPALGIRRPDLRFEIGVNVTTSPPLQERDYASEVTVLGAGQGRAMVRATTTGNPGRVRRAVVVDRKDIGKTATASSVAREQLLTRAAEWVFDSLEVSDHPMAPYGSFRPGDQIPVIGDAGWRQLDEWARVLDIITDCVTGAMDLKVEVT
jgi:hypothetical protein